MQVVNPLEIMLFIPLFDKIIYPALQNRGWNIRPLRRMGWGMLLAAASFAVSAGVEHSLQQRERNDQPPLSVLWQLPQITILAVAEIFLSVTGLEFAYANSPPRLKAFVMALFLLTTAVGDFGGGILYSTLFAAMDSKAQIMSICSLLMLVNYSVFRFLVVAQWEETVAATAANPQSTITMCPGRIAATCVNLELPEQRRNGSMTTTTSTTTHEFT